VFDTINHGKLLSRFRDEFGAPDMTLKWFKSYINSLSSADTAQQLFAALPVCRSVLGPLIFAMYVSPISEVISSHGVDHHQYADDTQLFLAMRASTISSDLCSLETCFQAVKHWFADNDLLLNADKSEALFVGSSSQLQAASGVNTVSVAGVSLLVSYATKSLDIYTYIHTYMYIYIYIYIY